MSELYRFDIDYPMHPEDEEGMKHIACDDGEYVLAGAALVLEAKVEILTAQVKSQQATIIELEAWKEKMREEFSIAVQIDLEHGVQWMNEEASAEFAKKYPNLCNALSLLEEDEEGDPNE